jgi:hypothetical protein
MELTEIVADVFRFTDSKDLRPTVEAIAVWTENLRDAMSASSGLEQAIISTASHSPTVLNTPIQRLVASLRYESMDIALRRFADEVSHPTCDFVVVALITASKHQTRDLGQLLTHLSECARAECHLYLRIWVSRARSRTAVRIIVSVVAAFISGLFLFDRQYLMPFASTNGVAVAIAVLILFGLSLFWLMQMARVKTPDRLFESLGESSR